MNKTGITEDKDNQDNEQEQKTGWMNNPDTIYSLSDVSDVAGQPGQETSFVLTDHGNVVASKATARQEAHSKSPAQNSSMVSALIPGQPGQPGQNLIGRIRSEIENEVKALELSDLPLGVKLVLIARAYGRDPQQWLPGDRVSNLFVEAVLYSAGLNLPWGFDSVPDYAELKYVLGQDKRFDRVFRVDKLRPQESARLFAACSFEDGDLAIWASNGRRLSCFLEKAESVDSETVAYNVLSAGCLDSAHRISLYDLRVLQPVLCGCRC